MSIVIEGMFRFTVPSGLRRTRLGKRIRPPLDRPDRTTNRLLKNFSESFDGAQDEQRGLILLTISVHAEVLEAFLIVFQQLANGHARRDLC